MQVPSLVDNEKKPTMGYKYGTVDGAKESSTASFNNNAAKYSDIFVIIDKR